MAIFGLFKQSYLQWSEDKASQMAAALAYYTIFSLAPMLIIAIAIAGFVWGEEAARGEIMYRIEGIVGSQPAAFLQTLIDNADKPGSGNAGWATLFSVILLLFGSTGVFTQLQDSLNTIWKVKPKPAPGYLTLARKRLSSFLLVLGIGAILLVSLAISAVISFMNSQLVDSVSENSFLWKALDFLVSLGIITLVFALIYKYLPDIDIEWRDVWVGAGLTALLFTIAKFFVGLYLGTGSFRSTYGAAGSLVLLLMWIYFSSLILFFGAEFTRAYTKKYGRKIQPDKHATYMDECE
jgi:membrane protein